MGSGGSGAVSADELEVMDPRTMTVSVADAKGRRDFMRFLSILRNLCNNGAVGELAHLTVTMGSDHSMVCDGKWFLFVSLTFCDIQKRNTKNRMSSSIQCQRNFMGIIEYMKFCL